MKTILNKNKALELYNLVLNTRQISDIELLLNGAFKPLKQYLNKKDYDSVLSNMRLSNGELWPIPIVLDIDKDLLDNKIFIGANIALRDHEGFLIATIEFVDEEIEKLQKKVAEKYGYKLVDHKLELYGIKKKS